MTAARAAGALTVAAILLDAAAVPVLLPAARIDLGASSSGVQWAQNAYLLAIAALLPALAAVGAWVPPRAIAICGGLALAAGAVVCASADAVPVLVAGRAVEGAGAAALLASLASAPAAVSLAGSASGPVGGLALAAPAVLPALALVAGPLAGGLLAQVGWWRVFFWGGVPLAAVVTAAALLVREHDRGPPARELPDRLAFAAALTAITIALVQAQPWDLGWPGVVALIGAAALLAVLSPWGRDLGPAGRVWLVLGAALATLGFLLPEYFELARGLSELRSGVLVLVVLLPAAVTWAGAWRLGARLDSRLLVLPGLACAALGLAALGTLDAHTRYALIVVALGLAGAGIGLAAGGLSGARPGEPLGRTLAATLTGAAAGLAAAGAVFQQAEAHDRAASASFEEALATGAGAAALLLVVLLLAAAPVAWRLTRSASAARRAGAS